MPKVLKDLRVLLVEDIAILALDLNYMLESHGAEVTVALTFEQGLDAATRDDAEFDVALLDGNLARCSSRPIAQILQEKNVGLVFHSAYTDQKTAMVDFPQAVFLKKPAPDPRIISALLTNCRKTTLATAVT